MIKRHPVVGAYARALLAVAQEKNQTQEFRDQLEAAAKSMLADRKLRVFFESPKISRSDKAQIIDRAFGGRVEPAVVNFLKVLIHRGRQMQLGEIVGMYGELHNEAAGRTHVRLSTAVPLSESLRSQLMKVLGDKLGREIIPQERVDAGLLGGLTIQIGDVVVDGSVRTKLNRVREALASERLGSDLFDEN